MLYKTYPIQVEGSLPDARLITYIQDTPESIAITKRPLVLICPGGGYAYTSDREAEPIALKFLAMGYHAAVLRYSCAPATYPTALLELAASILLIRRNAKEWHVNTQKIFVQGCSAGGHLAACLGMFWDEDFLAEAMGLDASEHRLLRPDGMILCYPVITSGEFAHRDSFHNLLGDREAELSAKLSLENQVSGKTPQAFIWGTFTDGAVPMENSLLLVSAMRRQDIPVEYHLYPKGGHGLALATHLTETSDGRHVQEECSTWIELADNWMRNLYSF